MKKGSTEVRQKLAGEVGRSASARAEALHLREAQRENEKQLYYSEHKVGQYKLAPEQVAKVPVLNSLLEYRAVGGVDNTPFDATKVHDADWFLQHKEMALRFVEMYVGGKIRSNFSTLEGPQSMEILDIFDKIASVQRDTFNPVDFKKKLDSYPRNLVYGSHGVFNLLLAFHRADQAVAGKDVDKVLYDLRVGTGKISTRYTLLREKLPAPTSTPVSAPAKKLDSKPKELTEDLQDAFAVAVSGSDRYVRELVESYSRFGWNIPSQRELSKDKTELLHTITVSGKKFYLRTCVNSSGIYFALDRAETKSPRSHHYLDFDVAQLFFKKKIDAHLLGDDTL
jgi:hypothetical protein